MKFTILLCIVLISGAVFCPDVLQAQKRKVLIEYPFNDTAGLAPDRLSRIQDLIDEFGEEVIVPVYTVNDYSTFTYHATPERYYRPTRPPSFAFAAINRRTDHEPTSPMLGIHYRAWRATVRTQLAEEPIVEIQPKRVVYDTSYNRVNILVECTLIWHKPDTNIAIETQLLYDSLYLSQRNYFDTVVGHRYYGMGDPIDSLLVNNVFFTVDMVKPGNRPDNQRFSYEGQDTVAVRFLTQYSFREAKLQRSTIRRDLYKMLFVATQYRVGSRPGPASQVEYLDIPVLDVAYLKGTEFEFRDEHTSVDEDFVPDSQLSLRVYPNPASAWLVVEHSEWLQGGDIQLIDMMGRTVKSLRSSLGGMSRIDVSALPEGMYTVLLRHQGTVQAGKVMVRK